MGAAMRTGDTADLIDHTVNHLLANSVVTTGICSSSKSCVHTYVEATHSCWQRLPCR